VTTVTQLSSCHHHFEICGCQGDTLEQEGDGSRWVPDLSSHKLQSDDGMKTLVIKWLQLQDKDLSINRELES
jgi:hypothetical protein